jgi:hypothetical protein
VTTTPSGPSDRGSAAPRGRRSRRRRRRPGGAPAPGPAPLVPEPSRLVAGATDALDADEIVEMKEHLAFVRRYKDILRLKLNAAEDLLVNGQREPSERGVCKHLLGKVDRSVVEAAIAREPLRSDAAARARMLAGAIRLTADVGVLLAYLETLAHVRSRAEAAQAFAEVVARIDFEALSATRLARLLQVLLETFIDHERVQVLFGLFAGATFRRAFDAAAATFPPDVATACAPLRAVNRRLLEGGGADDPALVVAGLERVLAAPDPVVRAYPEPVRVAMLELAVDGDVPAPIADRAAGVLLPTIARDGRTYGRLALRRASQLLARHADDRARVVLEDVRRAQPGLRVAERWLAALGGRRLGRVALEGAIPERGRLAPGLWLDAQRPVWVRSAAAPEAGRLANEAGLQAALALPGVAGVVEHGVASGIPYVAVSAAGRPLRLEEAKLDAATALALAATAVRVLRALALAGVRVPDAVPERFVYAPPTGLVLADLDGAERADAVGAGGAHRAAITSLVSAILRAGGIERVPTDAPDLVALTHALDAAALHASRG